MLLSLFLFLLPSFSLPRLSPPLLIFSSPALLSALSLSAACPSLSRGGAPPSLSLPSPAPLPIPSLSGARQGSGRGRSKVPTAPWVEETETARRQGRKAAVGAAEVEEAGGSRLARLLTAAASEPRAAGAAWRHGGGHGEAAA